ncbi:ADAMTS-like protein 5 isoform X11 [Sciurus carolinensis]|uniref:ADAMTS-like protein 5 isoform X11 n=1 Tax=Sciurus carolinensis TaxID=30640 RepID=UPI001FB520A3|nr:ADAMTS-like protein 5 isoform X11 [Sciurus carolinensis]
MGFSVCLAGTRCMGPLCSHRPRPSQSLLLLLWTLLNCVLGSGAQGPGEWTPWGSWSRCSSSCGRGVSVRSRRCIRFPGEESCSGISHEYRLCQLPDCPPGAVPFRDIQCALYNGRPVLGTQKTYQWIPFHGAPNQCDLNCLAEGHAFYHSFGRVLDGTPCSPGAHGLCVAGRCLSAGCDGVLGSGALEDRCGRCGGANDSCLFVQRVFRDAGAFAGYWNVTLIPEGARHIRVAHRSRNHLALMGVDGRYVLNGNWEVSPPGTYEAAGTRVVYARAAAPEETLRATGPTSQDLLLQWPRDGGIWPTYYRGHEEPRAAGCHTLCRASGMPWGPWRRTGTPGARIGTPVVPVSSAHVDEDQPTTTLDPLSWVEKPGVHTGTLSSLGLLAAPCMPDPQEQERLLLQVSAVPRAPELQQLLSIC